MRNKNKVKAFVGVLFVVMAGSVWDVFVPNEVHNYEYSNCGTSEMQTHWGFTYL